MNDTITMSALYEKLEKKGFQKKYIHLKILIQEKQF